MVVVWFWDMYFMFKVPSFVYHASDSQGTSHFGTIKWDFPKSEALG